MTEEAAQRLGAYIKRLREGKAWGVRELARRAGLSAAVIVHLESGQARIPRLDTFTSLATALEIPLVEMLAVAGQVKPCGAPCVGAHLRRCYNYLPEAVIREIEEYAERAVEAANADGIPPQEQRSKSK